MSLTHKIGHTLWFGHNDVNIVAIFSIYQSKVTCISFDDRMALEFLNGTTQKRSAEGHLFPQEQKY